MAADGGGRVMLTHDGGLRTSGEWVRTSPGGREFGWLTLTPLVEPAVASFHFDPINQLGREFGRDLNSGSCEENDS